MPLDLIIPKSRNAGSVRHCCHVVLLLRSQSGGLTLNRNLFSRTGAHILVIGLWSALVYLRMRVFLTNNLKGVGPLTLLRPAARRFEHSFRDVFRRTTRKCALEVAPVGSVKDPLF